MLSASWHHWKSLKTITSFNPNYKSIMKNYSISKIKTDFIPSASFDSSIWASIIPLKIDTWPWHKSDEPKVPSVEVKVLYSDKNLYLRYFVKEKFIIAKTAEPQGKVHLDSCVEFFVSPNENGYFNFELNCIGSIHLGFKQDRYSGGFIEEKDLNKIIVATSLTKGKAIEDAVASPKEGYIVEYSVPLELFVEYSKCERPVKGTFWRANFYKCGDNLPSPSWGVWSNVATPKPDFHRPEFFGTILFS